MYGRQGGAASKGAAGGHQGARIPARGQRSTRRQERHRSSWASGEARTPQHTVHSDSDSTQFVESELGSEPGSPASDVAAACNENRLRLPVPSQGSAAHGTGACHPCAWYWKPVGCLKAQECRYCHLCPDGELKRRRKQKVAVLRMGTLDSVESEESPASTASTEGASVAFRMTVKNTFIHMEEQATDLAHDTILDVEDELTTAGLAFTLRRRA